MGMSWTDRTEHGIQPETRCPICGGKITIRLIEKPIGSRKYWRTQVSDDHDCPLTPLFGEPLYDGTPETLCADLEEEWKDIAYTILHMPDCPKCGGRPVCRYDERSDWWTVACPEGHMEEDGAYIMTAMKSWMKSAGTEERRNQKPRLSRSLTELWSQGRTGDEKMPEFLRQSWRIKHAN